jgi:hypothetical protein
MKARSRARSRKLSDEGRGKRVGGKHLPPTVGHLIFHSPLDTHHFDPLDTLGISLAFNRVKPVSSQKENWRRLGKGYGRSFMKNRSRTGKTRDPPPFYQPLLSVIKAKWKKK